MTIKFLIVVEGGDSNYSAYSPDVLGCTATGNSVEETLTNIRSALEFHIEGLMENGEEIPTAKSLSYYIGETDEISSDDIIAHIDINIPEMAPA
jgi:predicted RNase H-like HicB family nuclease